MSTLQVTNIRSQASATLPSFQDSAGTEYGRLCRAFVNFSGTGTVSTNQTIRASFNVSTVFKNANGHYTINMTNAMPDTNYAVVANSDTNGTALNDGAVITLQTTISRTTNSFPIGVTNRTDGQAALDGNTVNVVVFR